MPISQSLIRFGRTVKGKFYKLTEGLIFFSVQLYGIFGLHDVPSLVIDWVDENDNLLEEPAQQMWALLGEYHFDNDNDYYSSENWKEDPLETSPKLTPKTRTWFRTSNRIALEISIWYKNFEYFDTLSEKDWLEECKWNSSVSTIPHVDWQSVTEDLIEDWGNFDNTNDYLM